MNKWKIQDKLFNLYAFCFLMDMCINVHKSGKKQRAIQNRRLKKLICYAYKIPFYKQRFVKAGVLPKDIKTKEDLRKLPVLTKEEYRNWMNEELKKPVTKWFKLTHTSGSTGIPTTNIYPPKEYACHYMMDLFCWMQAGYNPFYGKSLTCMPGDSKVGKSIIQKLGLLRRECFNPYWSINRIIEKINDYKPDFILANSSWLIYIANYAIKNDVDVYKPKYYCAGGENVSGIEQKLLENVFGFGMINYYGCTEMADFATRKPGENIYEVNETYVALNIVNEDGVSGAGEGSILATPLYRRYYPLINYEMGDEVVLEVDEERDVLSRIVGRKNQTFEWKNGKHTVFKELWDIGGTIEHIFQIRFIQENDTDLTIVLVKDSDSPRTHKELEVYLEKCYRPAFGDGVNIAFQWVDSMPPDPNGKIRNMISKINRGED